MLNSFLSSVVEPLFIFPKVQQTITRPTKPFDELTPPPPPNYNHDASWCDTSPTSLAEMRPTKTPSDPIIPIEDRQFDVFFVHPTTYLGDQWNGPLDDPKTNEHLQIVLAGMVSCFQHKCRLYCPRYRQATLASFVYDKHSGRKALDVAYSDIQRAFQVFLTKNTITLTTKDPDTGQDTHTQQRRPYFLAAHSQGGWLMARLLEEEIHHANDPTVFAHMVTCYCIGSRLPLDKFTRSFPSLHPSRGPKDLNCVVGWDTRSKPVPFYRNWHTQDPGHWYTDGWEATLGRGPILGTQPFTMVSNGGGGGGGGGGGETKEGSSNHLGLDLVCKNSSILIFRATPMFTPLKTFLSAVPKENDGEGIVIHGVEMLTQEEMYGCSTGTGFDLRDATVDVRTGALMIPMPPQPLTPKEGLAEGRVGKKMMDFGMIYPADSYHSFDIILFNGALRENIGVRCQAWDERKERNRKTKRGNNDAPTTTPTSCSNLYATHPTQVGLRL
jgi:hypothetical protein